MVYNIDKVDDGEPIAALRLLFSTTFTYFHPLTSSLQSRVFSFHFRETCILFRQGDWKLVQRPSGTSDWIEEPANSHNPRFLCLFVCLFFCLFVCLKEPSNHSHRVPQAGPSSSSADKRDLPLQPRRRPGGEDRPRKREARSCAGHGNLKVLSRM